MYRSIYIFESRYMENSVEIKLLSQDTIDKIAAGEVIERPVSVVKELTENAIDAGATAISVDIRQGGTTEIRVSDNGCGIPKEQIHTAFLRHATSKLRDAEELKSVRSLGFRGEALSSISAVSKVTMVTKAKSELFGSEFQIEGGQEGFLNEIGAPDGTTFIVQNLFYNTPARKKFLKSNQTEGAYIQTLMEHLALSHPEISFHFSQDGRDRLVTAGNGNLKDVILQVYGREILKNLIPVENENHYFHVHGFIGNYSINRGNRNFENFYVNGRLVEDKTLQRAVEEGYRGFLMQHQFPFAVLFFDFPDGTVDVNVHPAKREIRISDAQDVMYTLSEVVHNALTKREDILDVQVVEREDPEKIVESVQPFETKKLEEVREKIEQTSREVTVENADLWITPSLHESAKSQDDSLSSSTSGYILTQKPEQMTFLSEETTPYYEIIGQIFDTYWLFEWNSKIYIMDQHAAHEKINYERFMKRFRERARTSQMVSPAIVVTLSNDEIDAVEKYREQFEEFGFEYESFGGHEYQISGVPGDLYQLDEKRVFLDLADQAVHWKPNEESQLIRERMATIACKASIKGNQYISRQEIRVLMNELLSLEEPYHCPHGRPTMVSLTKTEIEKMFKRIVD